MRIERRKGDRRKDQTLGDGIRDVLHAETGEGRACGPGCRMECPTCGAKDCKCNCTRACANIPVTLSSDAHNYPLEPRIAPLVFEINRWAFFKPCWSCEGHLRKDGSLWKLPRVWFYCKSVVHLRILADAVKEMHSQKRLTVPWRVGVTFAGGDNPNTAFCLEPDPNGSIVTLASLQKDAQAIAEDLEPEMREQALRLSRNTHTAV